MTEKHEAESNVHREEIEIRKDDIKLQQSKLEFERQQFEAEQTKREEGLRLEHKERKAMMHLLAKKSIFRFGKCKFIINP